MAFVCYVKERTVVEGPPTSTMYVRHLSSLFCGEAEIRFWRMPAFSQRDDGRIFSGEVNLYYIKERPELQIGLVPTIEWIPTLRPQIRKQDVAFNSEKIAKLNSDQELNEDQAWKVLKWARENAFYLSAELCDSANALQKRLDDVPLEMGELRVKRGAFRPNPAMNDEYLLD
jgi:hypothetical protein